MLTWIVIILIVAGLIAIGYERGEVNAWSQISSKEDLKEVDENMRWKVQAEKIADELKATKKELKDAIIRNDNLWNQNKCLINENDVLTNQVNGYLSKFGSLKLTIEEKHQEEIISYYKQGLNQREIAEKIGCGRSTISRALKKRGLNK